MNACDTYPPMDCAIRATHSKRTALIESAISRLERISPPVSLTGFVPPTCDFRPHVPDRTDSYAGAVSEIRYVSRMRRCGTSRASGGRKPRRAIEKSISFIDGGSMSMTPVLPQGCCIVSGTVTSRPSRIQAYKLELEKQPRGND